MPTPISTDAFADLTLVSDLAVSPNGARAAFVARESDPDEDDRITSVFVVPTDGSRSPHRLTRVPGAGDPAWGPDGDRLAFLAKRDRDVARRVGRDDPEEPTSDGDDTPSPTAGDDSGDEDDDTDTGGDDEPRRQVWLFDLDVGGDARQVTDFDEGAAEFDWGPDGDRLVVAARDPTDEEAEALADRRDGGPVETERLQHKVDGAGYLDTVTRYLFVVDVESGAVERLDATAGGGAFEDSQGMDPAWGPTGRIAFTACRTARPDDTLVRDVYTIRPDGDGLTRMTDADLAASMPTWSPDGDRLAFAGSDPTNVAVPSAVFVHDLGAQTAGAAARDPDLTAVDASPSRTTGAVPDAEMPDDAPRAAGAYRSVTAPLDRTLAWTARIHWAADGEAVLTTIADEGGTQLVRARVPSSSHAGGRRGKGDPDGNETPDAEVPETAGGVDQSSVARTFGAQGDGRSLHLFSLPPGADRAVAVLSHPRDGVDLYALDRSDLDAATPPASFTRLSALNETLLSDASTPNCRRVAWESDGERIEGLLYHDPTVEPADGPHPLVVSLHGGPAAYTEPAFDFDYAVLTSRGYLVLDPNYRGGTSYGRAFCEALRGRWGTVEVADVVAGVEHAVESDWADPDRVFGYGFSYGGILQGYLVTQHPDLLTAAAPEHGIYDLRAAFGVDDTHVWYGHEYGLPWENETQVDASSAITDAGGITTPLLVMAGEHDHRCPPSQSEQLYVAARKQGVDAKLVLYPDEHHAKTDPSRNTHRLDEITAWYERFDPAAEPEETTPE